MVAAGQGMQGDPRKAAPVLGVAWVWPLLTFTIRLAISSDTPRASGQGSCR